MNRFIGAELIPFCRWLRARRAGATIDALRRLSTLMLIICAVLWIIALLMQAGVVHRQDTWAGPFHTEGPESPVVVLTVGQSRPLPGLTDTGGDNLENPSRSNIVVTVAGERWEVGHAAYDELRAGKAHAFIHWGDKLHLVLPPGLENGPRLVITADYTLQPRPWVTGIAPACGGATWRAALQHRDRRGNIAGLCPPAEDNSKGGVHRRARPGRSRVDSLRDGHRLWLDRRICIADRGVVRRFSGDATARCVGTQCAKRIVRPGRHRRDPRMADPSGRISLDDQKAGDHRDEARRAASAPLQRRFSHSSLHDVEWRLARKS